MISRPGNIAIELENRNEKDIECGMAISTINVAMTTRDKTLILTTKKQS